MTDITPTSDIATPATTETPAVDPSRLASQGLTPDLSGSPAIVRGTDMPDIVQNECLADIFEQTARTYPDSPALTYGEKTLTYAELDYQADLLADRLLAKGAKAGTLVGLWLMRGMDLLIAQLAIAKTGAGWLPMDADIPPERILICLADAQAVGLVTQNDTAPIVAPLLEQLKTTQGLDIALWTVEDLRAELPDSKIATDYPRSQWLRRGAVSVNDPAYVIYTSGSTGKPKGILLGQGSICHFLRSENARLGIRHGDKVYQGFSVAFDMSFEEIWMSYLVGASLWIAPKAVVADPEALYQVLLENKITVLHAVPTLVALLPHDVPSIRIMNLGGEMCPDAVVRRFAAPPDIPERRLFNTYGPTEATVSATLAQLMPNEPVTIGLPLPNYGLLIRSEAGELLNIEEIGELCIFGRGVALGYLGRPDLTAEKFIDNPYAENDDEKILYRTGDLAKIDASGQIYCLGRADDQVKVRGFRVELGEIEAALCDIDNIGTAAVVLRPLNDVDQLVAFIVADDPSQLPSQNDLRQTLRTRLPSYMVPARFEWMVDSEVPRLPSGKIDRKILKAMPLEAMQDSGEGDEPADAVEEVLFEKLKQILGANSISLQADFFDDLGGHSLLAARLVSQLRQLPEFAHVTIADIYQGRTVASIANKLRQNSNVNVLPVRQKRAENEIITPYVASTGQKFIATLIQTICLPFIIALQVLKWLAPFFTYHFMTGDPTDSTALAILTALAVYIGTELAGFAAAIIGNRVLVSTIEAGRYPLWGGTYIRWWLADRLQDLAPSYFLGSSSLLPVYLRALGADIGDHVSIGSVTIRNPHLLHIGNHVDIGNGVNFDNAYVQHGWLHMGEIRIADNAYIGSYSVLEPNTAMAEGSYLDALSALVDGDHLPANTAWQGAPVRVMEKMPEPIAPFPTKEQGYREGIELHLFYIIGIIFVSCLFFLPIFPTFMLVDWLDTTYLLPLFPEDSASWVLALRYFILALPATAVMIFFTLLISSGVKWLALPKLQTGDYAVHSKLYRQKWIANLIQEATLRVLHGIYASVYAASWFRLLGANVGYKAEISTAMGVVPDLLTLGEDSFIADAVMLGDEEIRGGWMRLKETIVGNGSFVGNGAYVPDGSRIPDGVLIGVQSRVPDNDKMQSGQTWFGTPAMNLPAREVVTGFADELTFNPSKGRFIFRAFVEGMRIVIPLAFNIGLGYMIVLNIFDADEDINLAKYVWLLMGWGILYGVASAMMIALMKWVFIGKYKPKSAPMWTPFVWLSEAITSLYEAIVVPSLANYLRGTVYLPFLLRVMGAHIGKNVWLDSTDMTEFDCVYLGDNVEFNNHTGPQTHLFEDRIMKIGEVKIGNNVTVRSRSTVLYDTIVNDNVVLEPMTLIMKGEQIPSNSIWNGSPAQSVGQLPPLANQTRTLSAQHTEVVSPTITETVPVKNP